MVKKIIQNLGNLVQGVFKGLNREKSNSELNYDPKTSAEEYISLVEAANPNSITIGNTTVFSMNLKPEDRIPEYKDALEQKADEILEKANITPEFRTYIASRILQRYQMKFGPSNEYYAEEVGINSENGNWGIFDPKQSKDIEKNVLGKMLNHEDELSMMHATGAAGINIEGWEKSFKQLYKENPI